MDKNVNTTENKRDWIIAVCCSDGDGIDMYKFFGTSNEVKKKLVKMVSEDKKEVDDRWDYGCTRIKDIEKRSEFEYYAYGCYSNFHIDYVARELSSLKLA